MGNTVLFRLDFRRVLLIALPGILLYGFVVIVPVVSAFRQSLFTDLNFQLKWAGAQNYLELATDGGFWFAFRNNLLIIAINFVFQICLAFAVAVVLHSRFAVFKEFFRVFLFLPVILAPIVVGYLWTIIYNYDYGLLNALLRALGWGTGARHWLSDPSIVMYAVIAPMTWQFIGFFVVIFLAGLSSVPQELLEAAEIDGASLPRRTRSIILPLMRNTWRVVLVLSTANGVKVFDQPFVMTRGGPGLSSTVLAQYAYDQSFLRARLSYAATVSVGMMAISLALVLLALFVFGRFLRNVND